MGFCCLAGWAFSSVGGQYLVTRFGADEGLPHSSVMDVAQTPDGYLWVGTLMGGISRYDGARFVNFDLEGIQGRGPLAVNRLFVDKAGRIWVNPFWGLARFAEGQLIPEFKHEQEMRMVSLLWSSAKEVLFAMSQTELLRGNLGEDGKWTWQVFPLSQALPGCRTDSSGNVWYLRSDRSLVRWRNGTNEDISLGPELPGHQPRALGTDGEGRLWLGTDRGLALWTRGQFVCMTPTNGEAQFSVYALVGGGGDGDMWVVAGGKIRRTLDRRWVAEARQLPLGAQNVPLPRSDGQGGLWQVLEGRGLAHVDKLGNTTWVSMADGLPSHLFRCLFADREGNLWVGYDRGGLVKIHRRLFQTISKAEGLADTVVSSVCEDREGTIWIGTAGGILSRWREGVCTNINAPKTGPYCKNVVVCPDARGRLWVGTEGSGVFLYEHGNFKQVSLDIGRAAVRMILADSKGRVWVGTAHALFCCEDGDVKLIHRQTGLPGWYLAAIAEAGDGTLWLGTDAGRLLRYNGKQFEFVPSPPGIPESRYWNLWPEDHAALWIGTYASGLWQYQAGVFKQHLGPFPNFNRITGGLTDEDGNLWLGTRRGIEWVARAALTNASGNVFQPLQHRLYGRSDGLPTIGMSVEYQPRCWKGRDGRLWFGTANGVACVNPKDISPNLVPPQVVLEEIRLDGQPVPQPCLSGGSSAGVWKVPPGQHDLEIHFSAPSMVSPETVSLRYRLDGLEEEWNLAGNQRTAIYRALPPGHYTFKADAFNCDGVPSINTATLAITVLPHFWQTKWFLPVAMAVLVGFTGVGVTVAARRRYRRRLERSAQQHAMEAERARICRDLHDELGVGLTQIGLLGDLVSRPETNLDKKFSHEISARARDLVAALDEIVWAINPSKDNSAAISDYFIRYAQTLLQQAGLRCRLDIGTDNPDAFLDANIRHQLFLAFKEALNNAITHAQATEVHLRMGIEKGQWLIRVEDNGRGFDQPARHGSPDGLAGMRDRLAKLDGQCEIKSVPGQGTSVTFLLPVKSKPQNKHD